MTFLGFLAVGVALGIIARLVLPASLAGPRPALLALAVAGAVIGGFLGALLFRTDLFDARAPQPWLTALGGALFALTVWAIARAGRRDSGRP